MRTIDKNMQFSHSLVNHYEGWLNAESDYNRYYGTSENPPSWEDYELGKKIEFYGSLFKVGLKSEFEREDTALLLGREFENLLNLGKKTEKFEFENNKGDVFNVVLSPDFGTLIENREKNVPDRQVKIEGILPNGLNFIGYADEIYSEKGTLIDVKTTSNFAKVNYDKSLQIPLYLHFLPYPINRGFYQVTEFYRSKAAGKNEFTQKDTFIIESEPLTDNQLREFSDKCAEILRLANDFHADFQTIKNYFNL